MPKKSKEAMRETLTESIKRRWERAERGSGGLRAISFMDLSHLPASERLKLMEEPVLIRSWEEEQYVVMKVEDYFALLKAREGNRVAKMVRHEGVLFREVL